MSTLSALKDSIISTAANTIGMVDDVVSGTRQLTKAYGHGTSILCKHAAYYDKLHDEHDSIKSLELQSVQDSQPKAIKDAIAAYKATLITS